MGTKNDDYKRKKNSAIEYVVGRLERNIIVER